MCASLIKTAIRKTFFNEYKVAGMIFENGVDELLNQYFILNDWVHEVNQLLV